MIYKSKLYLSIIKILLLSIFVVILVPIVVSDTANGQNKIHPDLMGQMTDLSFNHTEEKIRVIVILNEQYNPPQLQSTQSFLDKKQDNKEVVQSMKMQVYGSQSRILDSLEDKQKIGKVKQIRPLWIVNAIGLEATPEVIEELSRREDVAEIIPDFMVHLVEEPAIQGEAGILSGTPAWGVENINATDVWEMGFNGTGINVSIVDTGINYSHPDLQANYKLGYDFVNDDPDPMDDDGHGTHVAGTISGTGVGGYQTGVAPGANLFAVKVLGSNGYGNYSDIIEGVGWSVANGADIVSLSIGGPHDSSMTAMIDNTIAAGVLPVIAAGNDGKNGSSTIACPGDELNALTVGATDNNDIIADFSSRGPVNGYIKPDVVAPGVNIYSTSISGGYLIMGGTSMATPHVSGAAALILQAYPDMSPLEVKQLLESTAVDLGTSGKDNTYGSGRIDVLKAIMAPPPNISNITIYPNPTNINATLNATISHNINNISYVGFYIDDDIANVSAMSAKDGSFNSTIENVTGLINITTLHDGEHNVTFQAQNSNNYWNNQTSEVFTVDKTPPTITLNSPQNESHIKSNIIINLSIEDVLSAISEVKYNYNGTNVSLSDPYDIDISNWPEVSTTVHVWSYDQAGNVKQSSFNFIIDNTTPIITSVMHNATVLLNTGDVLWVNLTGSGGNESYFTIEDTSINQPLDNITSGYFSINYTIPAGLEIKDKVLTCYLIDKAGNINSSEADGNISIDSLAPLLTITSPTTLTTTSSSVNISGITETGASVTINVIATDNINGIFSKIVALDLGLNNFIINSEDAASNINSTSLNITRTNEVSSTSSSGGGGGGGSSGEERKNILYEKSERINIFRGDNVIYSFEGIPIINVNFTSKVNAGWIKSTIEVLKNTSTLVKTPSPLSVYQNVNIWIGLYGWANEQSIADALISFKVPIEWIKSNNIEEGSIRLYRYHNNTWNPLPTTRVNQDEINIYYNSPTPGFSPFAITGKSKPPLQVKHVPIPTPVIIENNSATSDNQVLEIESQTLEGNIIFWVLVIIIILSIVAAGYYYIEKMKLG